MVIFHSYVTLPEGIGHILIHGLIGAKRRECMGMGVAGMIIDSYCGSFSFPTRHK